MNKKFSFLEVITVSVAHFVHDVYTSFLAPILPLLIDKLDISLKMAGMLSVVRGIPSLLNPFFGLIADKVCIKYFIIIAPSISAITMSLLGVAPNYITLLLLLFITGIGSSLFHVPGPVMVKQVSGNKRGLGMSFFMLGGELSRSAGPIIILSAVSAWGLEKSYRLIPIGIGISILLYFATKNIKIEDHKKRSKDDQNIKSSFLQFLPTLRTIIGINFFRALIKSSLTLYLTTYLTHIGTSLFNAGIALSVFQFAGAVGTFLSGHFSDKIGRKYMLLILSIAVPPLAFCFLHFQGLIKIFFLVLLGLFVFGSTPVFLALVHDTKSNRPSFINGLYMGSNFVISSIAVMIIGALGDYVGLDKTFHIAAGLSAFSIPFAFMVKNRVSKDE